MVRVIPVHSVSLRTPEDREIRENEFVANQLQLDIDLLEYSYHPKVGTVRTK